MNTALSNKIKIFEFVMSVLIILVHSLSNIDICFAFINKYIQTIPVTPFFIFSGYFMMRGVNDPKEIVSKINKRFYTIFIPFILWNIIYYILYLILKPGTPISFEIIFDAALNYRFNPAFWFIYQLILLTLISPIFFYILKKNIYIIITYIFLAIILVSGIHVPYINIDAVIYYFTGTIISRYLNQYFIRIKNIQYVIIFAIISIGLYFMTVGLEVLSPYHIYIYNSLILVNIAFRLSLIIFLFYLIDFFVKYNNIPKYMEHTFFIYATHYIIIRFINLIVRIITMNINDPNVVLIIQLAFFISSVFFVIVIANKLYDLLNKKLPKQLKYLTGGR